MIIDSHEIVVFAMNFCRVFFYYYFCSVTISFLLKTRNMQMSLISIWVILFVVFCEFELDNIMGDAKYSIDRDRDRDTLQLF